MCSVALDDQIHYNVPRRGSLGEPLQKARGGQAYTLHVTLRFDAHELIEYSILSQNLIGAPSGEGPHAGRC